MHGKQGRLKNKIIKTECTSEKKISHEEKNERSAIDFQNESSDNTAETTANA